MLKDIVRGERKTVVAYSRNFDWAGENGWGFGFDCSEAGVPRFECATGARNYLDCLTGEVDGRKVIDRGVQRREHSYWQPGHGTCQCGEIVTLDGDRQGEGIDCVCGRIYNGSGQELRPRAQWEENYDDY